MRKKTVGAARLVDASFSHGFPYILEIKEEEHCEGKCLMKKPEDVELLLQELYGKREHVRFTLRPRPPTQEEFWEEVKKMREEEAAKDIIYGVPF